MGKDTSKLLKKAQKFYDSIGTVYCKPLKSHVLFNKHGWKHLKFAKNGRRRNKNDLRLRLYTLPFAPEVIRQAISAKQNIEERTIKGKSVPITYTELKGIVDNMQRYVEIVIRKFPEGSAHFYSIREIKNTHRKTKKPR